MQSNCFGVILFNLVDI